MADPTSTPHIAQVLLSRAHSPDTATRIFKDKIINKPLLLRPSSPPASATNARDQQQQERLKRRALRRKSNKPAPLSAKQKRALCVYEIPASERKYAIYEPLHRMWQAYMRDVLGVDKWIDGRGFVTPASAGPMLASADYHGAELEVVRSRCVSRVGIRGIVVKDLKFVFEIVTRRDKIKTVPKEQTVFRFEVPVVERKEGEDGGKGVERPNLVFEIHGDNFKNRAADRANKKFKQHIGEDV